MQASEAVTEALRYVFVSLLGGPCDLRVTLAFRLAVFQFISDDFLHCLTPFDLLLGELGFLFDDINPAIVLNSCLNEAINPKAANTNDVIMVYLAKLLWPPLSISTSAFALEFSDSLMLWTESRVYLRSSSGDCLEAASSYIVDIACVN